MKDYWKQKDGTQVPLNTLTNPGIALIVYVSALYEKRIPSEIYYEAKKRQLTMPIKRKERMKRPVWDMGELLEAIQKVEQSK